MNTSFTASCDALIAGAGPVGLTMASELLRHGLTCRIIDLNAAPTDKSKALVLWGRTLEMFDHAEMADEFIAAGIWTKGARMFGGGKQLLHVEIHRDDTAFPRPLMIPQNETERVLTESLKRRGLNVERQVQLVKCVDERDRVVSTLRHADGSEEQVTTAWLLGCDGSHSTVRKELGIEFAGEFEPNDWMLADVHVDGPISMDEISAYWHSDGVAIFFPFAPGRCRVIADLGKAQGTEKSPDPTLEEVQAVVDRRGPAGVKLHNPVWLASFRIHERKVNEYGRGRAFLCGDAAHIHSPAGGQGMNTGMQDAFNLAWKLALVHQGQAKPSPLLESYTQERSAVGDMVLHDAGLFTKVAMLRNPMLQFFRNHLMSLAGKLTAVQERAIATLTEMAVHYPYSPLNCDDAGIAWNNEVKAGDRLPDAQVRDARSGAPARLLESLRGTHHTLLIMPDENDTATLVELVNQAQILVNEFGDVLRPVLIVPGNSSVMPEAEAAAVWVDINQQVRNRLGLEDTAIAVVRPDGYLGFRGNGQSWAKLQDYLTQYLVPIKRRTGANALDGIAPQLV
ncbi:MAG TPA: FAD-dependent monooxygenase [Pirellulales bacterium]|jgi:2-polyprenyl-6-methoxyphenol hydroxylase-like FAD-dependent oxidoreductase|nr:FAD-dependent monooxygenase [Pirellulales bacterium]